MGRWLTFIAGITLILTAFNLVEIPLSAFAFFGGALAIGVGFGTQNLLKNLISGVMLLVEKPVRIGDMVEVDGVSGTVTSIGIRFSTLHSAHGTDTLIPNSVLVEQKLVNWTYSTADVRREIKVTVGYGSDVSVVTDLMLKACEQETNILDTPPPVVTLDDFGDNGLLFNLQVWLALQKGNNVAVTLSQLRMSILAAFREAGIELPYPQRLVHLNKD
jgi:small-conductance mechanosensitive channel